MILSCFSQSWQRRFRASVLRPVREPEERSVTAGHAQLVLVETLRPVGPSSRADGPV